MVSAVATAPDAPTATPRLQFRCWRRDDLPLALALWGDVRVTAWIGGPFDAEVVRARLDDHIAAFERDRAQYWPMFLRSTGDHVGCCGLRLREPGLLELGFHLRPAHWGQGLAAEAAAAAIGHGLAVLGAAALFAGHHPDNTSSRELLGKLGFTYTHDELYPPTGRMHRCYLLRPANDRAG